jgi:acyl-CoA thioester hydrolase|tara:strand:- start:1087 stop:1479 length:393 start_codon:yes stop_codon:yes gene_type:complete
MNYTTNKIKVRYNETDQMGIVHHSNYLKFFEFARIEWLEKLKMPYQEIERNNIILPVVNCELKFLKPLVFGDSFIVEVHCSKKPTSSIEFSYEIFNSRGEKTTEGSTLLAFLNSDTMKPVRCPKNISDLF